MSSLLELKQKQKAALDKAEALLGNDSHVMTVAETEQYKAAMAEYTDLGNTARAREMQSTIRASFPSGMPGLGLNESRFGSKANAVEANPRRMAEARSPEYAAALHAYLKSGGKSASADLVVGADGEGGFHLPGSEAFTRQRKPNGSYAAPDMSAAMYEGSEGSSNSAGGYAISVPTVDQMLIPLAMPDLGLFNASMLIPTNTDIKIPSQASFGTSAIKAESTGTLASFGGTDPSLGQVLLSSFMIGAARNASWELLQDVPTFQSFIVDDLLKGHQILVDSLLATGTGTNQPQGVFFNTGTGSGLTYELTGAASDGPLLINSLYDVTASLKAFYQPNASWIMQRATLLAIRKAQTQSNLFVPVVTTDSDGTFRVLGQPVNLDVNAPALPAATSAGVPAILYGDFKAGYLIGVRGGAGINVKILDQPNALQGVLTILAYQRIDGRVRRSEAMQQILVSHS